MYNEAPHWRLMNRLARFFGLAAVFVGVGFAAAALQYLNDKSMASRVPSASGSAAIDAILVAGFALVVGVLFLLVEPYRPDLQKAEGHDAPGDGKRFSWWTGEPK